VPEIAQAGAHDAAELARVAREALAEGWSPAGFRAELEAGALAPVAREGSETCGFALGRVIVDVAELRVLVVAPAWRRRGIGRRLLEAFVRQARARGATRVALEVRAGNAAARELYRTLGFDVEGRRPHYYPGGEDALLYGVSL
jgi:ribosomal-protein-alanine N-acetyltransferase